MNLQPAEEIFLLLNAGRIMSASKSQWWCPSDFSIKGKCCHICSYCDTNLNIWNNIDQYWEWLVPLPSPPSPLLLPVSTRAKWLHFPVRGSPGAVSCAVPVPGTRTINTPGLPTIIISIAPSPDTRQRRIIKTLSLICLMTTQESVFDSSLFGAILTQ